MKERVREERKGEGEKKLHTSCKRASLDIFLPFFSKNYEGLSRQTPLFPKN